MLDKRCHYKIRELSKFYLFIKHKRIYYAYFPQYKITRSTGCTNLHEAYAAAWDILAGLKSLQNIQLYKPLPDKKHLKRALSFIDQSKPLTSAMLLSMQKKLLSEGVSGKTINNYVCLLKRSYQGVFPKWTPLEHTPQYRKCFPVKSFYNFYSKCHNKQSYLAFFAMTTGCRAGEILTSEPIQLPDGRYYLKINGTKTANAVRTVPVLKETLDSLEYIKASALDTKGSVIEGGRLCGFNEDYIHDNNIVFHSYRKMYKTLLESCNINNCWVEYFMGHSQTSKVNQLYFIGESADDEMIYPKVIEALSRFL
jgi:integrase